MESPRHDDQPLPGITAGAADSSQPMADLLAREAPLLRLLIDNLPDFVYVKDTESRFLLSNSTHLRACGADSQQDLAGKTDFDIFPRQLAERYFVDEQQVLQAGEPLIDREEPVVLADGSDTWFSTTKVPVRGADGSIIGLIGIGRDITARRHGEEVLERERNLLRILIDNIPDYIFVKDRESRFIINNKAHLAALGFASQADVIGKTDFDIFSRDLAERYFADEQYVVGTGEAIINREEPARGAAGERIWLSTTKVPIHDKRGGIVGLVGISRDITGRKQAEEELQRAKNELEVRVQERTADLKEVNSRLAARLEQLNYLHQTSYELAQYIRMDELGPAIAKAFLGRLPGAEVAVCLRGRGGYEFLCATAGLSTQKGQLAAETALEIFSGIELQRPFICEDWRRDEHLSTIAWPGVQHLPCYVAIPLLADNRSLAIVQFFSRADFVPNYEAELPVLTTLAAQAASCLSNALNYQELGKSARMQGELDAARSIQQRFTPRDKPAIPRMEIKGAYFPAFEVGGDYLDYFQTETGHWVLVVADVCGKGVPAALFMIMLRSAFRSLARSITGAKALLCAVNESMKASLDDRSFVTTLCLIVNPDGTSLTYARAGHPLLLRRNRSTGRAEHVMSDGLAMGLAPDAESFESMLEEVAVPLERGDKFLVYTDGLTEATNGDKSPYGVTRLLEFLNDTWDRRPDDLVDMLLSDVQRFCQPDPLHDDLTVLAMEVVGDA